MAFVKKIAIRSPNRPWPTGGGKAQRRRAWSGARPILVAVLASLLSWVVALEAAAECRVLRGPEESPPALSLRLSGDCTERDREAEAVTAEEVLQALREGRDVDLVNALITGDLLFDALPSGSMDRLMQRHPGLREALGDGASGPVRAISGRLSIQDSYVRGQVTANPTKGYLIMGGPVTLAGTTFHRSADFTRTVFVGPLEVSRARFEHEAFFIQARFLEDARFDDVSFGLRARFHRSRFMGPAGFVGATFTGMAEFLEVGFMREASFARARFRQGAGFSGSRFQGPLDLSEALFQREAFFLYTIFDADANFRRTTFRGLADFSHAEFHGADDFATAFFDREPRFSRTTSARSRPQSGAGQDPRVLYAIAAVLFVLTLLLLRTRRRG